MCVLAFRICSSLLMRKIFLFYYAYEIDIFYLTPSELVRQTLSKTGQLLFNIHVHYTDFLCSSMSISSVSSHYLLRLPELQ
jgi:hypothetical protein